MKEKGFRYVGNRPSTKESAIVMMPLLMANAGEENIIRKIGGLPDAEKVQELSGSDMAHWLKMKPEEKKLRGEKRECHWLK